MVERISKSKKFIDNLLNFQDVKNLELCDDQGVKSFNPYFMMY